jgi:hypothetical protein
MNNIGDFFEIIDDVLWRKAFTNNYGRFHRPRRVTLSSNNGKKGYCRITLPLTRIRIMYHRIVWELVHGPIPNNMQIDHIDGNPLNNKISNLRIVTSRQNNQNRKIHRKGRLVGTCYIKKNNKWLAQCTINGRHFNLGYYNTETEAHEAYKKFIEERGVS